MKAMHEKKGKKMKEKPNQPGRTKKTIRFPRQIAEEVTEHMEETGGTFSGFVIAAVRKALEKGKGNGEADTESKM